MAANNLRIVYDNVVDYTASTITASSTASSTAAANNLKSDIRGLFWRSSTHTNFNMAAVFKATNSSTVAGRHSNLNITVTAGGGTSAATHYTITPIGGTEDANATAISGGLVSTNIGDSDNKTGYIHRVYTNSTKTTLLDRQTVPVIMSSAGTVTVVVTNDYHRCPGSTTAVAQMANSGTNIIVFDGTTPLRYDGVGTNRGTYRLTSSASTITIGTLSSGTGGAFATIGNHSAPTALTTTITYNIIGVTLGGTAINTSAVQTVVVSGTAESVYYNTTFDTTASRAIIEIENISTSSQAIGAAVLTHTNLTTGATMRVLGYNASVSISGTTDLPHIVTNNNVRAFDTGPQLCCPFNSVRQDSWVQNTYGTVTYGIDKQTVRAYIPSASQTSCSSLLIEVLDLQNTDNYIEASRLICGRYWSPTYNTEYGLSVGLQDTSETNRSEDGSLITINGVVYKTLNFNLNYMIKTDRNEMVKLLRNAGKRRGIFISLFPDNSDDWEQESLYQLYGKLSEGFDISHPYYQYFSTSIQLEEI